MADDNRLPLKPETPQMRTVVSAHWAVTLNRSHRIYSPHSRRDLAEMLETRLSERSSRIIDHDGDASMEQKKRRIFLTPIMNHSDDTSYFYHYGHRLIPERTRK